MDKEALQRQLEDMEEESERWRSEKRRLNAEIDKLAAALADAKGTPGRKRVTAPAGNPDAMDPVALAKIQEAAEQKVKHAREEWERDRAKLMSEINRLEGAVAEAIARASNPLRVTQPVKEQFEVELNRAAKEKTEVEQAFLRAKTQWEQERLKMTREMVKLRSAAQIMGRPVPNDDSLESNPKVRDLEGHLKDNLAQWNAERSRLIAQVQKLEEAARHWDAERRQLNAHAGQLQQAFMQAEAKIQSYEVAARKQNPAEAHVEELKREKDTMQRQSMQARMAWDEERRKLSSQIEQLEQQLQRVADSRDPVGNEVVDQLRLQYEKKLQETIQQKTHLAQELQNASKLLETERARLSAAHKGTGTTLDNDAIAAEVARVESQLTEIVSIIDNPNTELSTVIRKNVEKAELDAYLKGILFTLGKK